MVGEQSFRRICIADSRGVVQWGVAMVIRYVDLRATLQKSFNGV